MDNKLFLYDYKCDKYHDTDDSLTRILSFFAGPEQIDFENPRYNKSVEKVYKELNWNIQGYFDVICSFWTTFQAMLTVLFPEEFKFDEKDNGKFKYYAHESWCPISKEKLSKKFIDPENTNCRPLLLEENIAKIYKDDPEKYKKCMNQCKELAKLTHTVANFMPCPQFFNRAKGRIKSVHDYLPMMVDQIQEWKDEYEQKKKEKFEIEAIDGTIIIITAQEVRDWHKWLVDNSEKYGLSMYYSVDKDNKIEGKRFFDKQSLDNPIPKTYDEVLDCLVKMNACINERSKFLSNSQLQQTNNDSAKE